MLSREDLPEEEELPEEELYEEKELYEEEDQPDTTESDFSKLDKAQSMEKLKETLLTQSMEEVDNTPTKVMVNGGWLTSEVELER